MISCTVILYTTTCALTSTTPPADGRVRYARGRFGVGAGVSDRVRDGVAAGAAAAFVDLGSRVPGGGAR